MDIDYRKYAPGVALSEDILLVRCPVCDESAHRRDTKASTKFVHEVRIERHQPVLKNTAARRMANGMWMTPKAPPARNRAVPVKFCTVKASERDQVELRAQSRRAQGAAP
jgi:hypothetical protein